MIGRDLSGIPPSTTKILIFVPFNHVRQPASGALRGEWEECKRRVSAIVATSPNTHLIDFMLPSGITSNDDNYWDSAHYRLRVAERLVNDFAAALAGHLAANGDYVVLSPATTATR